MTAHEIGREAPEVDTSAYLRELSDLGRRHGFGLMGDPQIFILEDEDRMFDYSDDADGFIRIGAPPHEGPSNTTSSQSGEWMEELNLSDEARSSINGNPKLMILLYDLDLLPEQLLSQDEKTPGLIKAYHRLYGVMYAFFALSESRTGAEQAGEPHAAD